MLNVYISLTSDGLPYEKLKKKHEQIAEQFIENNSVYKNQINIIDSLFPGYVPGESNPIEYLGKSISKMKNADIVLMPVNYLSSKGCKVEKVTAEVYGIPMRSYFYTKDNTFILNYFIETIEVDHDYSQN